MIVKRMDIGKAMCLPVTGVESGQAASASDREIGIGDWGKERRIRRGLVCQSLIPSPSLTYTLCRGILSTWFRSRIQVLWRTLLMGKWRPEAASKQRINEQIRVTPIRVIGADGSQLGILATDEAMRQARAAELDLVEVAPNERPPVCRIMDFGKFKYQQKKRQHKGHAHQVKIKEIRVRPKTGDHDIQVKVAKAGSFSNTRTK